MTLTVSPLDQAVRHRSMLATTTFIAVTGSCGKTTTKNLVAAVLGVAGHVGKSFDSNNCGDDVALDMLTAHSNDRYFVQELGAWGPGTLDAGIDIVRPRISVVTNLRSDHYSAFHGPDGAQAEKGKLVRCLAEDGSAVLNWDDSRVRDLATGTAARVFSFGRHPNANLRAVDIRSSWPGPLTFTAMHGRERVHVRTRLLGEHLLGSALAALAVGLVCDLPLERAAAALRRAEPTDRRMTAVRQADDITFIRDDFKAPAESIPEVLRFMRDATARRKIAVFGRISDFPGRSRTTYTLLAREALAAVHTLIFVGRRAVELWGEQGSTSHTARLSWLTTSKLSDADPSGDSYGNFYVIGSVAEAATFLSGYLRSGDLVLLKGSGPSDHLERILLSRQHMVGCWLTHCGRTTSCDACELLSVPSR